MREILRKIGAVLLQAGVITLVLCAAYAVYALLGAEILVTICVGCVLSFQIRSVFKKLYAVIVSVHKNNVQNQQQLEKAIKRYGNGNKN